MKYTNKCKLEWVTICSVCLIQPQCKSMYKSSPSNMKYTNRCKLNGLQYAQCLSCSLNVKACTKALPVTWSILRQVITWVGYQDIVCLIQPQCKLVWTWPQHHKAQCKDKCTFTVSHAASMYIFWLYFWIALSMRKYAVIRFFIKMFWELKLMLLSHAQYNLTSSQVTTTFSRN